MNTSAETTIFSLLRVMLTVVACSAVAAGIVAGSDGSIKIALAIVLGFGALALVAWFGAPQRRFWLGFLFLTAPFDISKAVVAPLERFYSPGLYITIGQAATLVVGLIWVLEQRFVKWRPLPLTRLDALALGFLALVWFGALRSPQGTLAYASAAMYSFGVLAFYIVSHAVQSKADVRLALKMIILGFCLQALYASAQMATHSFLTLPGEKVAPVGTQGLNFEGENTTAFRPIGAFDHPNALADYLTLLVPPALSVVLMSRRRIPSRAWLVAGAVSIAGSALLLLTLSRGGWGACLIGVMLIGTVYWRRRIIGSGHLLAFAATGLLVVVASVAAFPQIVLRVTESDSRSLESRRVLLDQAATIIKAHPLLGVGYGDYNRAAFEVIPPSFALISKDYQKQLLQLVVHNHYMLLASELGLPAMCYWIYLMIQFVRQPWPLSRWRDPGMFALALGIAGSMVSKMVYLASDNYYADIRVFLLWLSAGLLQALVLQTDADNRAETQAVAAAAPP